MPLKIPICSFDAKTGILCPICEAKAEEGQVTQTDIEVSKALALFADRSRELDDVTLIKSHKIDRDFLLEVNEPALPVLRKESVKSELERMLEGRFWVTTSASSSRQLVEDLLYPSTVSELSTLWLPDGSKVSKAVVFQGGRLGGKVKAVQKLAKAARGIELIVSLQTTNPARGNEAAEAYTVAVPMVGAAR